MHTTTDKVEKQQGPTVWRGRLLFPIISRDIKEYEKELVRVCLCAVPSCSVVSDCDPMDCSSPGSSVHGDSPGENTGVGCH